MSNMQPSGFDRIDSPFSELIRAAVFLGIGLTVAAIAILFIVVL